MCNNLCGCFVLSENSVLNSLCETAKFSNLDDKNRLVFPTASFSYSRFTPQEIIFFNSECL